jgi:hypothetical protein
MKTTPCTIRIMEKIVRVVSVTTTTMAAMTMMMVMTMMTIMTIEIRLMKMIVMTTDLNTALIVRRQRDDEHLTCKNTMKSR